MLINTNTRLSIAFSQKILLSNFHTLLTGFSDTTSSKRCQVQEIFAKMRSKPGSSGLSRAAIYAQQRRDNEAEAREELGKQLPPDAFRPDFEGGDFNLSTKTLLAALVFLDPTANTRGVPKNHSTSPAYGPHRRNNEKAIRDRLGDIIPKKLFTTDITGRSDFNQTTKVMIAASLRVKELLREPEEGDYDTVPRPPPTVSLRSSNSYHCFT